MFLYVKPVIQYTCRHTYTYMYMYVHNLHGVGTRLWLGQFKLLLLDLLQQLPVLHTRIRGTPQGHDLP